MRSSDLASSGLSVGSRVVLTQGKLANVRAVVRSQALVEISLLAEQRVRVGRPAQVMAAGSFPFPCKILSCQPGVTGFIITALVE